MGPSSAELSGLVLYSYKPLKFTGVTWKAEKSKGKSGLSVLKHVRAGNLTLHGVA